MPIIGSPLTGKSWGVAREEKYAPSEAAYQSFMADYH